MKLTGTDIYGEVLGSDDTHVEVYYLIRSQKCHGKIWTYSKDWYRIPLESVVVHYSLADLGGIMRCLKTMGFRPINDSEFVLLSEEEHPDMVHVDIGFDDDDMNSSADEEPTPSDDDFVDNDYSLFTRAGDTENRFILETHLAVDAFRRWQPQSQQAQNVKQLIEDIEHKYTAQL